MKSFSSFLGFPISETDNIRTGLGISSNKINLSYQYLTTDQNGNPITQTVNYSPQVLIDYQNEIGHETIHTWTPPWAGPTTPATVTGRRPAAAWSRCPPISPCPAPPCSTTRSTGEANHYWPIGKGFVLYLDGQVGYGRPTAQTFATIDGGTTYYGRREGHLSRSGKTSTRAVCATCVASRTTPWARACA